MSTFTSQQTLKALCGHLRRPLCHPLGRLPRRTLRLFSSNHVGSLPAPISGYDTIAQRFSSYSKPLNLIGIRFPSEPTYLGITDEILERDMSWLFGIEYLAMATEDDAERKVDEIYGYLHDNGRHLIVPCVVSNGKMACWVYFLVATVSSKTFLSKKVNAPTYVESILSC